MPLEPWERQVIQSALPLLEKHDHILYLHCLLAGVDDRSYLEKVYKDFGNICWNKSHYLHAFYRWLLVNSCQHSNPYSFVADVYNDSGEILCR